MSAFKFVPRSALFGQTLTEDEANTRAQARSMPSARGAGLRVAGGPTVDPRAMPSLHQVQLLKGQLVKVHNDRARIVKEANAKLGALVARVRQLEGFVRSVRTGYAPGVQTPGQGQVDVGVPTHTLRNPNLYTVDGARGAPPVVPSHTPAGNPHDAAGAPHDTTHDNATTVRQAEDAIFYGNGDAAFYEGGENDD